MRVLVVNAGSSSLKLRLLDADDRVVESADLDGDADVGDALASFGPADAVGHRVVHGGPSFTGPVVIDEGVRASLAALTALAPLHQEAALAGIDAVARARPGVPAVACFDTAFHATLPAAASTYALPAEWRARWPIRRYGFHGLSHEWVARQVPTGRVVSCHLGSGSSLCAIADGRSVDTTMGFTPLEGLVMSTRSGSVDPGLVLWLVREAGLSVDEVNDGLEHRSGLLGLAGDRDLRAVLGRTDDDARLAVDVFMHRVRSGVAAMAASLGGLDTLVFTGGIGEHQPTVRSAVADGLAFLGSFDVVVVPTREDLVIAGEVRATLAGRATAPPV